MRTLRACRSVCIAAICLLPTIALAAPPTQAVVPARWTPERAGPFRSTNAVIDADIQSLAGTWAFRLDPKGEGIAAGWFRDPLPQRIELPGSTDEAGFGVPNTRPANVERLSRRVEYTGPAWYQRDVDVPERWRGKRIVLFLERCHWETQLWIDQRRVGARESLSTPHVYDLGDDLSPGKHRLTIRVDNTVRHFLGAFASSISEETQTNWNGIVGRIELRATDPVWFDAIDVYPDVARKSARVRLSIGNATGGPVDARLAVRATPAEGAVPPAAERAVTVPSGVTSVDVELPLGDRPALWDEFSPRQYLGRASLDARSTADPRRALTDAKEFRFGQRCLSIAGKRFTLNGRPIFLRGTLECCIFPRTGYPAMDEASWARVFTVCREYGLNHLRFHSWCPPEAAFAAADRAGFLLQVEAPRANVPADPRRDRFIAEEVDRILAAYGNHPSFAMLCMGNELDADTAPHNRQLVLRCRQRDPRHLYTASTAWGHIAENQFNSTPEGRGVHAQGSAHDARRSVNAHAVPVVYHEIGEWAVFPNLAETAKYTGVLRPTNFDWIRSSLAANGLADHAAEFNRASGLFSVLLYKEEIELLLRTPDVAGFQLLDIHDYPGTGSALVGMLDAFWDSKGLTTPQAFRGYCSATVPLARLTKRTYIAAETLSAQAEVCHFGPQPLVGVVPEWKLEDDGGRMLASGTLARQTVATGRVTSLGSLSASLAAVPAPRRLTLTLALRGTPHSNQWQIWVYPALPPPVAPSGVLVARQWNAEVARALAAGGKVLLMPSPGAVARKHKVRGRFLPVFWSPTWFPAQAGSMGLLCDTQHPALRAFPTDTHTNWQWFHLLAQSCSLVLDEDARSLRPIVRVIDDFAHNRSQACLLEARVGKGRLLLCTIDLPALQEHAEGRQLLRSLYQYVDAPAFAPQGQLDVRRLEAWFAVSSIPAGLDRALLRVEAAVNAAKNVAAPWTAQADAVLAQQPSFHYRVDGKVWRDDQGAAWFADRELTLHIDCPKGFTGRLLVHFHDYNENRRAADVLLSGGKPQRLENYGDEGVWLAIPVSAAQSAGGGLKLTAKTVQGNVVLSRFAVVP